MNSKLALSALALALTAATAACSAGGSSAGDVTHPSLPAASTGMSSATSGSAGSGSRASAGTTQATGQTGTSGDAARPSGASKAAGGTDHIKLSPTVTTNVVAWYHGSGGAAFTELTEVLNRASQANASGGATAFGRSCGQIGSAARAAQAAPPMPVPAAIDWYTSALHGYVASAADCQRAVSGEDGQLLQRAVKEVEANSSDLNRAAAVLITALSAEK